MGSTTEPEVRTARTGWTWLSLAAMASAAAGLVHAAAAGTHTGDTTLARLFAVTAAVQLGWAALAVIRPSRRTAMVGVALGVAAVGAWVLSRSTGLPLIDSLREVEPVGLQDGLAATLAAISTMLAAVTLVGARAPRPALRLPVGALGAVALLALAVPAVAAQHAHGPSHEHDGGHEAGAEPAAGHGGGHDEGDHGEGGHGGTEDADPASGAATHDGHDDEGHAEGPVVSLTDARIDDDQRAAAQQLLDDTTAGMARFSTVESVTDAGYISIGDGVTGWEHFVHIGHMSDGADMDPDKIESIVFKVYPDGTRQLASAMYILGFGATMDDVPDIAGELTSWHDHQDLCWVGAQVTGRVDAEGNCAIGTFRGTAPMLHVWMIPHRCGPFAGIEGSHGSGCGHDHGGDDSASSEPATRDEETAGGS